MQPPVNLREVTEKLLGVLDARSRDVISRRFGLRGAEAETLEAIGKEYGITRERVRQIESATKKTVANLREVMLPVTAFFDQMFSEYGGVMAERQAVEVVQQDANHVRFYLNVLPEYRYVTGHELFHPHWHSQRHPHEQVKKIVQGACEALEKQNAPMKDEELIVVLRENLDQTDITNLQVSAALTASQPIERTVFQEWGLVAWPEVSPRGVGDKAYAVLRRQGKPAHFRDIASKITESRFDGKQANAQTVHNELIKDERFVLVGRGLYGLREWGYVPGTVADVLENVIRKSSHPLSRGELIEEVLKQRLVKKNTILLGLQNSKRFTKVGDRYTTR